MDEDIKERVLFVTNKCNSNCIMCPDSENMRKRNIGITYESLMAQLNEFPDDIEFLCITGGEPTLLRYDLIRILERCREKLNNTDFLLLSNGRSFSDMNYAREFSKSIPNLLIVGIPLYESYANGHEGITRVKGSFGETVKGINNLLSLGVAVELRVVVMKYNYKHLSEISRFIAKNFPNIIRVNFMSLEVLGNAFANKENVWIDLNETKTYIKDAAMTLFLAGIKCQLYNFPLCYVDHSIWSLCRKSISKNKVKYADECDFCQGKDQCGGFFNSTFAVMKPKVNIIK